MYRCCCSNACIGNRNAHRVTCLHAVIRDTSTLIVHHKGGPVTAGPVQVKRRGVLCTFVISFCMRFSSFYSSASGHAVSCYARVTCTSVGRRDCCRTDCCCVFNRFARSPNRVTATMTPRRRPVRRRETTEKRRQKTDRANRCFEHYRLFFPRRFSRRPQ